MKIQPSIILRNKIYRFRCFTQTFSRYYVPTQYRFWYMGSKNPGFYQGFAKYTMYSISLHFILHIIFLFIFYTNTMILQLNLYFPDSRKSDGRFFGKRRVRYKRCSNFYYNHLITIIRIFSSIFHDFRWSD